MDTPASHGGAAPPPMPTSGPEPAAEATPQAEADTTGQAVAAPQRPAEQALELEVLPTGDLDDLQKLWKLGQWLALIEGDLTRASNAAGAMRWYLATELQLPSGAAIEISIIDGRPYYSARLLRILALRQGFRINPLDHTDESCTALLEDVYGHELGRATYTMEDAQRAGLAGKRNYQRDPASMLWARAARRVLDFYAPNVLFGLPLPTDPPRRGRLRDEHLDFHGDPDEPSIDGAYLDDDGIPM